MRALPFVLLLCAFVLTSTSSRADEKPAPAPSTACGAELHLLFAGPVKLDAATRKAAGLVELGAQPADAGAVELSVAWPFQVKGGPLMWLSTPPLNDKRQPLVSAALVLDGQKWRVALQRNDKAPAKKAVDAPSIVYLRAVEWVPTGACSNPPEVK